MPWSDSLPQFSLVGTILTVVLLLFAAVGEPLLGRRAFTWLSRRRGDARALTLLHAVTMGVHVLWGLAVLGVLLLSPELAAADLGLRPPHAWGPVVGGAVGGLLALAVLWVLVNGLPGRNGLPGGPGRKRAPGGASSDGTSSRGRRGRRAPRRRARRASTPFTLPEPERDRGLLVPRTAAERGVAAGVAVTGGVFGELLYRALFIVLVASMGAPLWAAAVLSVALFSVAHLYQGWWGLVSAGVSGTLFTVLYLGTGSVWVPVLVHVALNLRSLAFPPADVREAGEREYLDVHQDGYGDGDPDDWQDGYDDVHQDAYGDRNPGDGGVPVTAEASASHHMYPYEWIDHQDGDGNVTPGPGPGLRD